MGKPRFSSVKNCDRRCRGVPSPARLNSDCLDRRRLRCPERRRRRMVRRSVRPAYGPPPRTTARDGSQWTFPKPLPFGTRCIASETCVQKVDLGILRHIPKRSRTFETLPAVSERQRSLATPLVQLQRREQTGLPSTERFLMHLTLNKPFGAMHSYAAACFSAALRARYRFARSAADNLAGLPASATGDHSPSSISSAGAGSPTGSGRPLARESQVWTTLSAFRVNRDAVVTAVVGEPVSIWTGLLVRR
jgi:hypothetical protein